MHEVVGFEPLQEQAGRPGKCLWLAHWSRVIQLAAAAPQMSADVGRGRRSMLFQENKRKHLIPSATKNGRSTLFDIAFVRRYETDSVTCFRNITWTIAATATVNTWLDPLFIIDCPVAAAGAPLFDNHADTATMSRFIRREPTQQRRTRRYLVSTWASAWKPYSRKRQRT